MSPLEVLAAGPYNFFYTLAVAAAALSMFQAGRRAGWGATTWGVTVGAWVAAGMVGAMLPHILFGDAVAFRTIIGAMIFATLVLAVAARALRRDVGHVLDTTAVAIPLGAAVVRVGCFLAECCQGIATSLPIGVALHPDDVPRHPVQLYEAALELALACGLSFASLRMTSGRRFAASIGGMCAIRFATEFVRDNDKYGGLSLAQWVMLPLGVICLILLLSKPRAARPRRVLTTSARRATIGVVGLLAMAAVAAGLTALESTLLLIGAGLLIVIAIRRLGRIAPTGLTVLALQMPVITADSTFPRSYRFFGVGAGAGAWDFHHVYSDCDGNSEEWTRHHSAKGMSFEVGGRTQFSETRSTGIHARGYYGVDDVGAAVVETGSPASPAAYSRINSGGQVVGDADWKWFGASFGLSAGRFYPMTADDLYGRGERRSAVEIFPAIRLRLGPHRGVSIETRVGDESPMWVPGPAGSLSLAAGDGRGNRVRLGASDGGVLLAGNVMTADGWEVLPTLIVQSGEGATVKDVFHGGVTVRKWVRVARRPPDER